LMAGGRYYDWGYNRDGQVGDGSRAVATTAMEVALPHAVRQVFEGGSYGDNGQTIALLSSGAAWEWGSGRFGQLGDGTRHGSLWPIRLDALHGLHLVAVGSGGSTTYAVDRAGGLWAWGNNHVAQLGDGSIARLQLTPVRDPVRVSQVSSTAHNVAALAATG
jgi:alpha-tubulin suppressor-like RCC1 family protein